MRVLVVCGREKLSASSYFKLKYFLYKVAGWCLYFFIYFYLAGLCGFVVLHAQWDFVTGVYLSLVEEI